MEEKPMFGMRENSDASGGEFGGFENAEVRASGISMDDKHDQALCAADVRAARLDRDAWGRVHPEIRLAVALQVLRSIRDEQIGASSAVRALCAATLDAIG